MSQQHFKIMLTACTAPRLLRPTCLGRKASFRSDWRNLKLGNWLASSCTAAAAAACCAAAAAAAAPGCTTELFSTTLLVGVDERSLVFVEDSSSAPAKPVILGRLAWTACVSSSRLAAALNSTNLHLELVPWCWKYIILADSCLLSMLAGPSGRS